MNCYRRTLYGALSRIMANLVMLGAVFIGMYQASRWPGWPSEAVFCLIFFGITIPIWLLSWIFTRWLERRYPGDARTLVNLPGHGSPQLVAWQVRDTLYGLSPQKNCN